MEYCNTIDLLFYYLHTYVGIIYYHIPFYFIKSINSKNKNRKFTMYNFLFEHLLKEQTKHNVMYYIMIKILDGHCSYMMYFTLTLKNYKFSYKFFIIDVK